MPALSIVQQPVYGLPFPGRQSTPAPLAFQTWTFFSPGTQTIGTPNPGDAMLVFVAGNQYDCTAVSGLGATWTKIGGGGVYGGNYATASAWVGVVGAAPSNQLTLTCNGSNQQYFSVYRMRGQGILAASTAVGGNVASESIQINSLYASALVYYFTRGGTLSIAEAGWTVLVNGGNGTGVAMIAWNGSPPGAVQATITGRTDNAVEILAALR